MKVKMKRIMAFFLALVICIGYLPLNPIVSYANDNVSGDVPIDSEHFPNEAFRNYVKRFDTTPDNKLSKDELDKVTEIDVQSREISSLKGIEHFQNLKKLNCFENDLESLDLSNNPNLTDLNCGKCHLHSLDVRKNTELTELNCACNGLVSLDVSNNTKLTKLAVDSCNDLASLDVSNNTKLTELNLVCCGLASLDVSNNTKLTDLRCDNQQYAIRSEVDRITRKFSYGEFPSGFDKNRVVSPDGANFGPDAVTVNSDTPREVTYKYKVDNNRVMDVRLRIDYYGFDPQHVEKMVVIQQPTKRIYTDGEKLDLTGLKVKLTDNQGLTEDVEFKDFETYHIKANPKNDTPLTVANNNKPVTLTTGKGKAQTDPLTVNPEVVGPIDPTQQGSEKPADISKYWTVSFTSADTAKGTVSAKNTVYVLKSATKTLANIQAPEKTANTGYEFDKWEPALDAHTTIDKDMTVSAYFKSAGIGPLPTLNPPDHKPQPKASAPTPEPKMQPKAPAPTPEPKMQLETLAPKAQPKTPGTTPELKLQPETSAAKLQAETKVPKLQPETKAPKLQPEKHIGMLPKTGESASFEGLLAALGFSITGLAILRKKKMMKGNNK